MRLSWVFSLCLSVTVAIGAASSSSAQELSTVQDQLNNLEERLGALEVKPIPDSETAAQAQEAGDPSGAADEGLAARNDIALLQARLSQLIEKIEHIQMARHETPLLVESSPVADRPGVGERGRATAGAEVASAADVSGGSIPQGAHATSGASPMMATAAPGPVSPRAESAPPAASVPKPERSADITLKPGRGFTLESPDKTFSLQPGGRILFRHSLTAYDGDRKKDNLSNFAVERFDFWLIGKAFAEWNYKFEGNFGKGNVKLSDGFVEWGRYDAIRPKMGQFKVTFDRQMRNPPSEQSFVDRSATAKTFGLDRDIGLMLSGATKDKKFQYNAGIFNGEGDNKSNTGAGELAVIRVSANPNGDFGFSESDPKGTAKYLWVADAAVAYNASSAYKDWNNDGTIGGHDDEANVFRFVAGLGFRHAGLFAQGEYYGQNERPKLAELDNVRANGWYTQLGYMIVPSSWELAARYSVVDPDASKSDNSRRESTIGVSHFLLNTGHAMKMSADVTLRTEEKGANVRYNDVEVRTQLQVSY